MDAREYLSRKGLDGERDKARPTTLEEKAWSRAREAGEHRPRAATPHDWEDWERYHELLAEGAESLEQKIDPRAHAAPEAPQKGGVEHFIPPAEPRVTEPTQPEPSTPKRPEPFAALVALAILMPPLAVGLTGGSGRRVMIALLLMLAGWVPGVAYALWWLKRR